MRAGVLVVVGAVLAAGPAAGDRKLRARPVPHTRAQRQDWRVLEERLSATQKALAAAQTNLAEMEQSADFNVPDDEAAGQAAMFQTAAPAFRPSDRIISRPDTAPHYEYKEETKIHDSIPWTYEACLAVAFLCVIAGGPVLFAMCQGDKATKTMMTQATLTCLVLLGGMWAFMNVLWFKSSHFEGERRLTLVETVYLMAQIITTVGYGDIVPAYPRGQVVVGCYVVLSLFLIVDMVSTISRGVMDRADKFSMELTEAAFDHMDMAMDEDLATPEDSDIFLGKPRVSYLSVLSSAVPLLFFILLGIFFFHYYPGEEKTWLQAIYMSVVTLSTTGFGAFTAVTTGGQVFSAFWMIFGVAALVSFVGAWAEMMMKLKASERFSRDSIGKEMETNMKKVKPAIKGKLDREEFLHFAVLQLRIATADQLKSIDRKMESLYSM